jgi:trehalose 6-phosphate phosphatase
LAESQEKHPSALERFEAVLAAAEGKEIVMFLDYDGTLSPIVDDPDSAVMTEDVSFFVLSALFTAPSCY